MNQPKVVVIPPLAEDGRQLWALVLTLAREFGPEREWSLKKREGKYDSDRQDLVRLLT
jgi:hypothetical protein